jgi:hypothetical protein
MQTLNTLLTHTRILAMASMLALSVAVPAINVHAEPRGGASGADTRPDNAKCEFVTAGFYDCTTPDGGEWYCTNDTDPTACVQIKSPSRTTSGNGFIHPVIGGTLNLGSFDPGTQGSPLKVLPQAPISDLTALP